MFCVVYDHPDGFAALVLERLPGGWWVRVGEADATFMATHLAGTTLDVWVRTKKAVAWADVRNRVLDSSSVR